MDSDELAVSLAAHLEGVTFFGLTSHQVTTQLTTECRVALEGVGYTAFRREHVALDVRADGRNGRMDIVAEATDGLPYAAVEIDRANKRWSMSKLRDASDGGWLAVWVRWGALTKEIPTGVGVGVVRLRMERTPGPTGRPVWSH